MDIKFNNKCALVTGGGRGIGRAIALALVAGGANVTVLSVIQEELDLLKTECPSISTVCVDLRDWAATRTAVENVGRVDLLVNNAGVVFLQSFLECTEEKYDCTFDVNVKAIINVSQGVAKGMIAAGIEGSIVNISSKSSKFSQPDHALYCASKAAVDQLTKVMALELGKHKIRVNCVNPTVVLTAMGKEAWSDPDKAGKMLARLPLGRFAEVEDIVRPVMYLLSDQSAMITGHTLMVDGGYSAA